MAGYEGVEFELDLRALIQVRDALRLLRNQQTLKMKKVSNFQK